MKLGPKARRNLLRMHAHCQQTRPITPQRCQPTFMAFSDFRRLFVSLLLFQPVFYRPLDAVRIGSKTCIILRHTSRKMAVSASSRETAALNLGGKTGLKHGKTQKSRAGWHDWNGNCWTLGIVPHDTAVGQCTKAKHCLTHFSSAKGSG